MDWRSRMTALHSFDRLSRGDWRSGEPPYDSIDRLSRRGLAVKNDRPTIASTSSAGVDWRWDDRPTIATGSAKVDFRSRMTALRLAPTGIANREIHLQSVKKKTERLTSNTHKGHHVSGLCVRIAPGALPFIILNFPHHLPCLPILLYYAGVDQICSIILNWEIEEILIIFYQKRWIGDLVGIHYFKIS